MLPVDIAPDMAWRCSKLELALVGEFQSEVVLAFGIGAVLHIVLVLLIKGEAWASAPRLSDPRLDFLCAGPCRG